MTTMETSNTRRPWEATSPSNQSRTLPSISTLTHSLDANHKETSPQQQQQQIQQSKGPVPRYSAGSWSGGTGIGSTNTMPYLNSSTDHSPDQQSQPYTPTESTHLSSAFSSTRNSAVPNHGLDLNIHRGSGDFAGSRRGSADTPMHAHMDALRIGGPTSPYNQSANVSQSSLASSLQQQRGIPTNGVRLSSGSGPISPHWSRSSGVPRSVEARLPGRIAPPIMEHPRSEGMFAAEPVRGQPWAFPDPDAGSRPVSTMSRRTSQASSFTSTIYSELNRPLPVGQQELPDHHHHTAMPAHARLQMLRDDEDSQSGATPYSRTPELRVTHKLAERKRRSEMKDCFEQLRVRLPASQNNKSSKWETLARAIDYITMLENRVEQSDVELARQREHMQSMETKIKDLEARLGINGTYASAPPNPIHSYAGNHYANGVESDASRTLPPIVNGGAMQGVQYGEGVR